MEQLRGNVLVAQGGGPTAVINQSLLGVVLEARKFAVVDKVYGAMNGVEGIINEDFYDLTLETDGNLERVAATPSSGLLSTRVKPDENFCDNALKVIMAHNIRYFFYIGGNDSSDTVRILNEAAKEIGYEFIAVHIPKTIDNDLVHNDHTPGFGSAAKFVAQAFMGVNLDNRALQGVYIGVVMGRHAGFLTAASSLARVFPDDGPHLIYLPERTFSIDKFIEDVKRVFAEHGRCIVAVSEGIQDENGTPIITKLAEEIEKDQHGNVQLSGTGALGDLLVDEVKKHTDIGRVRADTFGYLQRSFIGVVSDVDQREAREVAQRAVQHAIIDRTDGSMTIKRNGNYAIEFELRPLKDIAAKTRHMPDEFINDEGNDVTEAFYNYCRPLVGTGFPTTARIIAPQVEKILNK